METHRYKNPAAVESARVIERDAIITPEIEAMLNRLRDFEIQAEDNGDDTIDDWPEDLVDIFERQIEDLLVYPDDVFEWFVGARQDMSLPEVKKRWQELLHDRLGKQLPLVIQLFDNGASFTRTMKQLSDVYNSTFLFQSICRILLKERGGELSDIESLRVQELSAADLSGAQKKGMSAIVAENYTQLSGLADDFRRQLESAATDATVYHLLDRTVTRDLSKEIQRVDREVVGFVRVGQQERGFYISGFHMRPELQASGIGLVLIESVISQYQKQGDLYALAEAGSPALNFYLNVLGAKEVRRIENTDPTRSRGVKVEIMLPKKVSQE